MITAGIDIGSITAKAAIFEDGKLVAAKVVFTGYNAEAAGQKVYDEVRSEAGIDKNAIAKIVSTGYGRNSVKFADKSRSSCYQNRLRNFLLCIHYPPR